MVKKKLKLNDKTECMLFGTENSLKNYEQFQHIMIGTLNIKIVPVLQNLGVYIDSNLTMKNQILSTVKVCNHHLRNIAFQEYEEPVYSYSTYPDRRFSSRYHNILKMSPPFASSEGVSASGDRYQSDGV